MKFDQLNSDDKEYYFNEVFGAGIYTIPEFSRRYGMPDLSDVDDVNAYVAKHYPDKYKKIVQEGFKMCEGDKLGATPKGYTNVRKADIIAAVAKKTGATKKAATEIVNAYWATIKETLEKKSDANITIPNVGSIRCVRKPARKYKVSGLKNTSKTSVSKPAKTTAKFFVSSNFIKKSATSTKTKETKSKAQSKSKSKSSSTTKSKTKTKRTKRASSKAFGNLLTKAKSTKSKTKK